MIKSCRGDLRKGQLFQKVPSFWRRFLWPYMKFAKNEIHPNFRSLSLTIKICRCDWKGWSQENIHKWLIFDCLFDFLLYVPSTIFQLCRDGSSWVEPVLSQDKRVLLKDHNTVTPIGSNPRPIGLESSTLPLSHCAPYKRWIYHYLLLNSKILPSAYSEFTMHMHIYSLVGTEAGILHDVAFSLMHMLQNW